MKTCCDCKEELSLKSFSKNKSRKDGLSEVCKSCMLVRQYSWRKQNPERWKELRKKSYHRTSYYSTMAKRYGLSKDEISDMLDKQNNVCAICQKEDNRRLAIDHCHETNKIRGLLCGACNRGLGLFKDDVETLKRAIDYLKLE